MTKKRKEKKAKLIQELISNGCLVIFIKGSSFKYEHANGKLCKNKNNLKQTNDETMPNTKYTQTNNECQIKIKWTASI